MAATIGLAVDQNNDRPYRTGAELGVYARRLEDDVEGLDALWMVDNPFSPMRSLDPLIALAAIAAATTRLRLGTGILVASFRNPLDLARSVLSLDQLASGRLLLGVGAGNPRARAAGGFRTGRWGDRYDAMIETLVALTRGEKVTSTGETWELEDAGAEIDPIDGGVKVLLAAISPQAFERSARVAAGWVASSGGSTERFRDEAKIMLGHLEACGRPRNSFTIVKRISVGLLPETAGFEPAPGYHKPLLGSADEILNELWRIAEAGADHIVLDPVDYGPDHIAALCERVITPFARAMRVV